MSDQIKLVILGIFSGICLGIIAWAFGMDEIHAIALIVGGNLLVVFITETVWLVKKNRYHD